MTIQINEYIEELVEVIPDLVVIFDSNGKVINVSQNVLDFYNIQDKNYFIGKHIFDFVVSEQLNELKENFKDLEKKGYTKKKEYKLLKTDGSYFHGELNSKVIDDKMNREKLYITIVRDVTPQKNLLRELNNSKQMFQLVLDNIPQHIFWKDINSKYLGCNRNFARVAGVGEPENIVGNTDFELAWKFEEAESYYDIEHLVMESGTPEYHVIESQLQADGKQAWLDVNRIPLHDLQGKVIGILGTYEDITERKVAEEKLKESEEKFRNFAEQSLLGINIVQDNKIKYINRAFGDIFEYSIDEVKDWGLEDISQTIHPDDREFALGQLVKKQRGEKDVIENYQYRGITKSGRIRWIDVYSKTIKYEGNPADFITIIDVTEKKESEEKFRTIAEQSFLGIAIIQDGKIKYVNETLLRIVGYDQQEVSNWSAKEFFKLVHTEDLSIAIKKFQRMETGNFGKIGAYPYRIFTKSGELKWIEINSKVIQYQGKNAILVSLIDVTPKKKAEKLIIEENKRLLELDKLRKELITRISHELRTPLTSVYGVSQVLLSRFASPTLSEDIKSYIEISHRGILRLKELVDNLLDASRLETQKLELKIELVDLSELINGCIEELSYLASSRKLILEKDIPNDIKCKLDKNRLSQSVINLISNAIKNTPSGGIIYVKLEESDSFLDIIIKDTGVGITKEEKQRLFQKFGKIERYGQDLDVDIEGAGLGLYISKEIVELHGGKIFIESKGRNKGAKFVIRLFKEKSFDRKIRERRS